MSFFSIGLSVAVAAEPERPAGALTIVLVGDSTVSEYKEGEVMRGWGQMIGKHFSPGTKIVNLALAGASTKTFLESQRWNRALQEKPDYVFIQFGHNDSHKKGLPESTDADGDYMTNLGRFLQDAHGVGARPILVTPMHRRTFTAAGVPTDELLPYIRAMKIVAADTKTPLVDLYASSGELFTGLGEAGSEDLTAPNDRTHFTEAGAMKIAALVVAGLKRNPDPRLQAAILGDGTGKAAPGSLANP